MAIKFIDSVNMNNALFVNGVNERVGIGMENPATKLEVDGVIRATNSNSVDYLDIYCDGDVSGDSILENTNSSIVLISANGVTKIKGESTNYPSASLQVFSSTTANVQLNSSGDSYFNGGDVGIGTTNPITKLQITAPNSSSPTANIFLDIDGVTEVGMGGQIIFGSSTASTLTSYIAKIQGVRNSANDGSSDIVFQTTHVATTTTPSTKMIIKSNGNVGIGTDSPDELLHLKKSSGNAGLEIEAVSAGDPLIRFVSANNRTADLFYTDATTLARFSYDHSDIAFKMYAHNQASVDFYLSETKAYFPQQNVGIGTQTPGANLDIKETGGSTVAGYLMRVQSINGGGDYFNQSGFYKDSSQNMELRLKANVLGGSDKVIINSAGNSYFNGGNIGIGEENPAAQLHIADSSNNSSGIRFTTVNGGNNDAVNMHFQGSQPFAPFYISRKQTGGAEIQLQFDGDIILNGTNGDNTGIGTTQPQQKLHVNGNILCGSTLYFDTGTSNSIAGTGGALNFRTNSSDVMLLKFGGDVDIFNSLNVTDKVSVGGILQVKDQIDLYQDGNASTIRGGIAIGTYGNYSFVTNFTNDVGFSFNNRIFLSSINQSSIQADLTGGFNSTEVCNFVMTDLTGTGNNYANLELKQMSVSSSGSSRTTNTAIKFANGSNAIKGTITFGNGGVSYNTTSDYRLKEDFKDFNGLDLVSEINVYDFKWKEGGRSYGVKAHELQEINEDWATGEKDEIGEIKSEDGTHVEGIIPQQVDYSALVPVLIKSIQELEAKVKDLESRI